MGISPKVAERKMSDLVIAPVSNAAVARSMIAEIAGHCWDGKGCMLMRVHKAIKDGLKHLPNDLTKRWTRRRVRAFWDRETENVRFNEVLQLAYVAQCEKAKRGELEEAKKANADYIQRISTLASALAERDAAFHSEQIEAIRTALDQQVAQAPGVRAQAGRVD